MQPFTESTTFTDAVEQALKHFKEAQWLGEHSPLSSTYFLGTRLAGRTTSDLDRGRVLQELLRSATEQIGGRYKDRYQVILREYYFQSRTLEFVCDLISLGRNSFHLNRNDAIRALSDALIEQTSPALRLESRPQPVPLFERSQQIQQALVLLQKRQSVSLIGSGGMGKTSLGAKLAEQMGGATFWYTIRPGLNDHAEAFLFALAYFLHTCGSSAPWMELVASAEKLKLDRILSMVRYALQQLPAPLPLLCIDEVDLLTVANDANHSGLAKVVESLRGSAALLLIGQRPLIETEHFLTLTALSKAALYEWLQQRQLLLKNDAVDALYNLTLGNPRLLQLSFALYIVGEPLTRLVEEIHEQPALEFLLGRMLQRLDQTERGLLMELAVFRRPAPTSAWDQPQLGRALMRLHDFALVQEVTKGGVELHPVYRNVLYHLLPDEKRSLLHEHAAAVRLAYGEYLESAYHLVRAGKAETAIWLWYEHRQQAINQGQASTALLLLRSLQSMPLSTLAQETLTVACVELERLTGNIGKAQEDIHSILWKTPILSIDAHQVAGMTALSENNFTEAENHFRQGLKLAERIVETRLSQLHWGLAWRHLNEREIERAVQEVTRARFEVEYIQGVLSFQTSNFGAAETHWLVALQIAEDLNYLWGLARTSNSLAAIYLYQSKVPLLMPLLQKSASYFEKLGASAYLASLSINWALAHNLAEEYNQALVAAQHAYQQLETLGSVPQRERALIYLAMSESYLGQNALDSSQDYARQVIEMEDIDCLPDAYRMYGEVQYKRGQHQDAIRFIQMSIELATQNEDWYIVGYGWRALIDPYLALQQPDQATAARDQAIQLFEKIGLPHEVEKTKQRFDRLKG